MSKDVLKGKTFLKSPGHFIDEATEQVEEVKRRHSIVSLFESYGVKLKKTSNNGSYTGLCPWHDDHTPSLSVDETKGLYHCFGCDAKGDIIELVRKMEGVSFREALKKLEGKTIASPRAAAKKPSAQVKPSPPEAPHVEELIDEVGTTDRLSKRDADKERITRMEDAPKDEGALASALVTFNDVATYYHKRLLDSKDAVQYLVKRGITNTGLYERFMLGFADGTILSKLSAKQKEALKVSGILTKHNGEHFHNCIVFPIIDDNEKVVGIYGRKITNYDPRHLYLPGSHRGVWNRKASRVYDEIVLVESIIDALSLVQIGVENVQPLYGTNGFTAEHLQILKDDNVKTIVLALDNDEAGGKATEKLKASLLDDSFAVKTIFPKLSNPSTGLRAKDWNEELLAGLDKETFKLLVGEAGEEKKQEAEKSFEITREGIKDIFKAEHTCSEPLDSARDKLSRGIVYEIVGAKELFVTNLRVNVKAIYGGESYYDNADLASGRSRRALSETLAQLFGIEYRIVERDLMRILDHYAELRDKKLAELNNVRRAVEITDEDRELGLAFLKAPDMFGEIVRDMEILGYVGENVNKQLVYLAASSRKLDDPISVIIVSQSSAGKSLLVETMRRLMPEEDVLAVTSLSDQALNYIAPGGLLHKLLIMGEAMHSDEIERQIREMLSGKRLSRMVVLKDDKGGVPATQTISQDVVVSLFMSTTASDINPENASRCFIVNADESEEQTERIQKAQREKYTLARYFEKKHDVPGIVRKHQAAQRILRNVVIVNDYGKYFRFPKTLVRTRRDHDRFVDLVVSVCFLRQYRKETKMMNDPRTGAQTEYIECDIEDYRIASDIMKAGVLDATYADVPKSLIRFYEELRALYGSTAKEKGLKITEAGLTQRDIRKKIAWIGAESIKQYLRKLTYLEYLQAGGTKRRGARNTYLLVADEPMDHIDISMIPTSDELAENIEVGKVGNSEGKS
jgi:DNA primase